MKSKVIVLMIFLPAIAASFVTQKSSARQSGQTKDSTTLAPAVSVRERFVGTWKLVSTEYRYTDGTRRPYPDAGPHGKGYLMYGLDGRMCAQLMNPDWPAWKEAGHPTDAGENSSLDGLFSYCGKYEVDARKQGEIQPPEG